MTAYRYENMDLKNWLEDEWKKGNRIKASKIKKVLLKLEKKYFNYYYNRLNK